MSCFWGHTWKVTKVETGKETYVEYKNVARPISLIHRVCMFCKDADTKQVDGHYQLSEFS